ncbi:MAG TPA: twin-arginine translocase subunit TatC [Ilumatobacteraceae bacterium]|nr:twin-arginine translocase subunit TatC [Ilumatobacteraceae bacterium]HRB02414.1 twin-arginine translocase subunit TatC [Ilumatobacteraceae bacterium]
MKVPFRGGADQPKVATPDDRMTLTQHLAELRTRIIRSVLAIVFGIIIIVAFYDQVLRFLRKPYTDLCTRKQWANCGELQFLGPLEGLSTRLSIATYGGIIIALPVLMWQLWRFIVPALHAKEKKYAIPFVLSSVFLFLLGGVIAYWTLGPALDFLISWAGSDVEANFQVSKYISLVGLMIAAFGIAFEFPVLLVFLQLVGVLTPQMLAKQWRYAIVIIFVIAAVITPSGDPYSMMALAGPMTLFYLISILIGLFAQKRKRARQAAAE